MKSYIATILKLSVCLFLIMTGCKQEYLHGIKTEGIGKVYFPDAAQANNAVIPVLSRNNFALDTIAKTVDFPVPIYRGGFSGTDPFTVDISVDNSAIAGLIKSGALPANTVELAPDDYTLASKDTLSAGEGGFVKGNALPKVKVAALQQYSGKVAALGLALSNASKFSVNDSMNKVVIYFDVDSLLDDIVPPQNLIDTSAWQVLNIAGNDNVMITFNQDGSISYTGGNGGHKAIYQPVTVQANKKYKIDMDISGSGATNTWFEAYAGTSVPSQGHDYTDNKLISLNTWSGCGTTPFNGSLSELSCSGPGNIVSFPTSGTVYILIKSGGDNLGTKGITISNIVFIRVQ